MENKRPFGSVVILAALLLCSSLVYGDTQGWNNNSVSFKIDTRCSLVISNETRHNEITFSDRYLKNWQVGLVYKLSRPFYLSFAYKRDDSEKSDYVLHENRFTLEAGWKTDLGKKTTFDCRFKTEIRRFEEDRDTNHLRFRLRFRLKSQLKIGRLQTQPFLAFEPFADTKADRINRYRLYAGTVFPMGKHAGLIISYIRQGTRDKETLNILYTGVQLKF